MKVSVKTKTGVNHFRRAGIQFGPNPKEVDVDESMVEEMKASGMLEVSGAVPAKKAMAAPAKEEAKKETKTPKAEKKSKKRKKQTTTLGANDERAKES